MRTKCDRRNNEEAGRSERTDGLTNHENEGNEDSSMDTAHFKYDCLSNGENAGKKTKGSKCRAR